MVNSDNEDDPKKQSELCAAVLNLNRRPQLKKASRAEPALEISEFNLVKSLAGKKGSIKLKDLTKKLKKNAKQGDIIKKAVKHTLPTPLEKPQADRIRRTAAFGKVQKELSRWEAVVTSNRSSDHLSFPLPTDNEVDTNKKFSGYRLKSKLQKELEAIDPPMEVYHVETEPKFPLTMQEMLERRQEMARMRALQSYSESKARRQGRIKSKKFHRIQKKAKIKEKIKEFEKLQESDPTEALKKLEEIEKVRVEERASLRHRSTGKWAQNKQVRAKYDKESRQVLAQQLSISRELTQKLKANDDSDEDDDVVDPTPLLKLNENNPWTNSETPNGEVHEFLSNYTQFIQDRNSAVKTSAENNSQTVKVNKSSDLPEVIPEVVPNQENIFVNKSTSVEQLPSPKPKKLRKKSIPNKSTPADLESKLNGTKSKTKSKSSSLKVAAPETKLPKLKLSKPIRKSVGTTFWDVRTVITDISESESESPRKVDLDKMFDSLDKKLQSKFQAKSKKLKRNLQTDNSLPQKRDKKKKKTTFDLSIPKAVTRPIIDEELMEQTGLADDRDEQSKMIASLKSILKDSRQEPQAAPKTAQVNINPNSLIKTRAAALDNENPDLVLLEDEEEDEDAELKGTISEAFEDVDIVDEFNKDKQKEIQNDNQEDISLALPGWGSWGGVGIQMSKRKKRRFIVKFPKNLKRKDDKRGNLIINENVSEKIKPHLVSEVPFPFKTVQDYEASIRAPIGNTFVPETAFRNLIQPAVETKLGTAIQPMTDDILLKKDKKKF